MSEILFFIQLNELENINLQYPLSAMASSRLETAKTLHVAQNLMTCTRISKYQTKLINILHFVHIDQNRDRACKTHQQQ